MSTLRTVLSSRVAAELRVRGPTPSRELRGRLGASPATFARAIASIRGELVSEGATSALTFALRRPVPGLPLEVPLYDLAPEGVRVFAVLTPVFPTGWHVRSHWPLGGYHPDLPWFLHDLRPAGFLGRLVPRQHPELGLPANIQSWSADHAVRWLHEWGVDTVGSFVLGEPAFRRLQEAGQAGVPHDERRSRYPLLAEQVMSLGVPGSSVAGEQPKFLATRLAAGERRPVLVKFSPRAADPPARRTADLLRCEHHALECLRGAGVAAAASQLVEADGRVFLEVERFDRQGEGRLGLVSLLSVAALHGAGVHDWIAAADDLYRSGAIGEVDLRRIYWLDRFGSLIGNTDRHAGNLSFFFQDGVLGSVAPVYDMLPMAYAVRSGEFATPVLSPPAPTPRFAASWREAWAVAVQFWDAVARDEAIHADLRQAARANAAALDASRRLLERLPGDDQLALFQRR